MANAEKTLVTVATYNEMENLPELVKQVFETVPEVDLLVIDDNSPDGTGRWCDEKAADEPRLNCLHRAGKLGLGTATIAGMKYAIEHGYRFVLNMDADFSHHPKYLPDFLAGMEPAGRPAVDVLIGSRYVPGGGVEGWGLKRHFMSRGVNLYSRWLLGLKPKDCSGAFATGRRAARAGRLRPRSLARIRLPRGDSLHLKLLPGSLKRRLCSSTGSEAARNRCQRSDPRPLDHFCPRRPQLIRAGPQRFHGVMISRRRSDRRRIAEAQGRFAAFHPRGRAACLHDRTQRVPGLGGNHVKLPYHDLALEGNASKTRLPPSPWVRFPKTRRTVVGDGLASPCSARAPSRCRRASTRPRAGACSCGHDQPHRHR